jgi:threonylcarbamoyladenosine tRNA methylthiotransferase MtaB
MCKVKDNKKIKLYTLGCKVNQYESQAIREQLLNAGLEESSTGKADIYVINTCTVTAQADKECRRLIRKALRSNAMSDLIVTGCLVEKDAGRIFQISDKIRIVPNHLKGHIADFLNSRRNPRLKTHKKNFIPLKISDFKDHERAFVKIQDGCNNRCSYCKVPLVRGKSASRDPKEIIAEVKRLTGRGFKEIVLTGICLGAYRYKGYKLVNLLRSLEKIAGEFRIRLSSIEPQLVSDALIKKVADSAVICPHLHIPLQSGDNEILRQMNRPYTVRDYLSLIAKIKKKISNVAITTDVLAGFPGEKESNFRNTVRCLKKISPMRTHIFSFSPREGTAAFDFPDSVEAAVIKKRVNLLRKIAGDASYKYRRRFSGRYLTVLIESQRDKQSGLLSGYSENYIRIAVEGAGEEQINKLLRVKIRANPFHTPGVWKGV